MTSLLTAAIQESDEMVETFTKAARARRPAQLPQLSSAIGDAASTGYGSSAADHYRYFRAWLYIAADCRASAVSQLPWCAAEVKGAEENPKRSFSDWRQKVPKVIRRKAAQGQSMEAILSHPVLDLLAKPNDWQNGTQFVYFSVLNLDLTGQCFWIVGQGDDGEEQLLSVPTSWMRWAGNAARDWAEATTSGSRR